MLFKVEGENGIADVYRLHKRGKTTVAVGDQAIRGNFVFAAPMTDSVVSGSPDVRELLKKEDQAA